MMTAIEKVAYLKGLVEGMEIDKETKEGKLLGAVIDVLEELAYSLEDVEENALDIAEELDAISDDLADVEDYIFGEEDGCGCCDCEDDDECGCGHGHGHHHCGCGCEDEDMEYSVICPSCDEELLLEDEDLENGELVCPVCGETLELEFDEDDEEEDDEEEDD